MTARDVTRDLTMAAKAGFRDGKTWGIGLSWLWTAITKAEDNMGATQIILSICVLGYFVQFSVGKKDYRGGS